jgi:hypothetical protein
MLPDNVRQEVVSFWWVWTKRGRNPRYFHGSPFEAEAEAQRLALKHPGQKFIVLHAYTKFFVPTAKQGDSNGIDRTPSAS